MNWSGKLLIHDPETHQICGGCGNCIDCLGCDGSEYERERDYPEE